MVRRSRARRVVIVPLLVGLTSLSAVAISTAGAAGQGRYAAPKYPTVGWPAGWVNPVQGGGQFTLTTKWGAFSLGCKNADKTNGSTYYLDKGLKAHTGIDMARGEKLEVVAIADGTVVDNGQPWGAVPRCRGDRQRRAWRSEDHIYFGCLFEPL